ncbi:hypothetical protein VTL71DRAFT_12065 [Oculimacula yallundae]|uniref:BTB domain-containing protein n=1 Tax=Oculimacula yallundae TaxID=86028 RepID=A0ABR4CT21_9HELO
MGSTQEKNASDCRAANKPQLGGSRISRKDKMHRTLETRKQMRQKALSQRLLQLDLAALYNALGSLKLENTDTVMKERENSLDSGNEADISDAAEEAQNSGTRRRHLRESATLRFGDELVLLKVGPQGTQFTVHKNLICASAPFFDAAFQPGAFKEGIEGILNLPEDHPGALGIFVEYLYLTTIPHGHTQSYIEALYHLWFFIPKLCTPDTVLRDTIMDKIQDVADVYHLEPSPAMVQLVFAQTPTGSVLRLFCIDVIAFSILATSELQKTEGTSEEEKVLWAKELDKAVDLVYEMTNNHPDIFKCMFHEAIGYSKTWNLSDPRMRYRSGTLHPESRCRYHEHGPDVQCHLIQGPPPLFIRDVDGVI